MSVFDILGEALTRGAQLIEPLFGTAATAAAIVLFTLGVRAALHPLARAAARGEKARAALAPQIAALQRKYGGDRERLQQAMSDLYAKSGSSPLAGCLPSLLQIPVFFVMYHLFSTGSGTLLNHTLLGAPLGGTWRRALADGGMAGPQGLVYLALFALIAAVATWNYRRARAAAAAVPTPAAGTAAPGLGALGKLMPLLSFGTLITVAVVPLAAGLYMVTTTTWTACERALLHRNRKPAADGDPAAAGKTTTARRTTQRKTTGGPKPAASTTGQPQPQSTSQAQPTSTSAPCSPSPGARAGRRGGPKSRAARQKAARARANAAAQKGGSDASGAPGKPNTAPRADNRRPDGTPIVTTAQ
ncbi:MULTISPECIES: YidC/Oxa1 family membrane protein insertase [unclassified Streptomyces]|uniref:YidC/Oxa1 family membrane protein insertase n=1 Tax=unclassified Streptomyces TaxID=2593676 RepID=UPI00037F6473|nr:MULTISPECIES: YidC/Oxa1 family membrane protein insertase [unclassified Streptomyces]MYT30585.1 membrane protein insertase YidC [Streptomyces sp. SID8354]